MFPSMKVARFATDVSDTHGLTREYVSSTIGPQIQLVGMRRRSMADNKEPHEIEKIIAERNIVAANKASAAADEKRETNELAAKVKQALVGAQETLREEIKKANEAIKRGGRTEEFRFQPTSQPSSGTLLTAN